MAKKHKDLSPGMTAFAAAALANPNAPVGDVVVNTTTDTNGVRTPTGTNTLNPPIKTDAQLLAEEKAKRDEKAKADKEAKAKEKADKLAAKEVEKTAKAEARAKSKADRAARLEALAAGHDYKGSMLALAERTKAGVYVKGSNGQLRSTDELAVALDGISATDVVRIGLDLLKIEDNPYTALNIGQQSMNLRNRMRGAIKKEVLKIADVTEYVVRNKIHVVTAESVAKAKAEREEKAAAAKADREAKAEAKVKAEAEAKQKAVDAATAKAKADAPAEASAA